MDASSNDAFTIVGAGYRAHQPAIRKKGFWARLKGKPTLSVAVFSVIALGCLFSNLIINHDPAELFLMNVNEAPNAEFWFGTDSLGRDIYSIIWYGGRASIFIGLMSAAVITLIGVSYGCLSGVASGVVDSAMMRAVELLQSVPVLLSLLLILSLMGKQNELTIALVIGVTGWVAPFPHCARSGAKSGRSATASTSSPRAAWARGFPSSCASTSSRISCRRSCSWSFPASAPAWRWKRP